MGNAKDLSIHDDVTVEADIDGLASLLPAFVTNILAEEIWLATKLPDERIGRLQAGQSIHLTLERDGAVMIVDSTFLRRLGAGARFQLQNTRVFAVKRPSGVDNSQRRAHVRVDMDKAVKIKSVGGGQLGAGRTVNIGAGGILFTTSMPLLFGEELRLAIALTSREIVIAGGSIVRIEDPVDAASAESATPASAAASGTPPLSRVAVRFDTISEQDQERITCFILKELRARRNAPAPAAASSGQAPAQPPTSVPSKVGRDGSAASGERAVDREARAG